MNRLCVALLHRDGDRIKSLDSRSRFAKSKVASQAVRGSHRAENDHQACQNEAEKAHTAVYIYAVAGNQEGLQDQHKNPEGKNCAVNVNEQVRQRRAKHPCEIICTRESEKTVARMTAATPGKQSLSMREVPWRIAPVAIHVFQRNSA